MDEILSDFRKFATSNGVSGSALDDFVKSQSYIEPTIVEERTKNIAQLSVFSRLMMDRILFLGSAVDDTSANILLSQMLFLDTIEPGKDITLYINSPGGHVNDGLAIYDTMKSLESRVGTVAIGTAASMAATLLAAGDKGLRKSLPHSEILIHPIQVTLGGSTPGPDYDINYRHTKHLEEVMFTLLAQDTGNSVERIRELCNRDNWLTPEQAKEIGIIDEILPLKKCVKNME